MKRNNSNSCMARSVGTCGHQRTTCTNRHASWLPFSEVLDVSTHVYLSLYIYILPSIYVKFLALYFNPGQSWTCLIFVCMFYTPILLCIHFISRQSWLQRNGSAWTAPQATFLRRGRALKAREIRPTDRQVGETKSLKSEDEMFFISEVEFGWEGIDLSVFFGLKYIYIYGI